MGSIFEIQHIGTLDGLYEDMRITSIGGKIMEHIQFGVAMMILLFVFTAIIGIWMKIANGIGEKLRVGKFFMRLYKSIGRDSK